ncbi:hypothetical protein AArcCO_1179 [Halalkaliarchaeum sp. AArc-CO]|uniref:hypothetical protein n=1 Tax=unclassified Halalkaliarchaeum TaxID=2678344 RepID=UPI00217ECFC4|nr:MULTISPECIES: hypothetical protein [unclassified Halalkaliarchaeum]MDR5672558.1 hypothetical protein [Halalkaliarchaeum sp. AArc-GB]UWG50489.1 hypothetical protein AArcCO_1179 [Halalkaliarchaeum sp. AArc-CO]
MSTLFGERGEGRVPTGELYHVVCRDCTMEELVRTPEIAAELQETHHERTDHAITHERIQ